MRVNHKISQWTENAMKQSETPLEYGCKVDVNSVRQKVFEQIGVEDPSAQKNSKKQPFRWAVLRRGVAIAAAVAVLTCGGVFAAGQIFKLGNQPVEYIDNAKNVSGTLNQFESLRPTLEQMTTQVNETVDMGGVTATLQTVSADSNVVDVTFVFKRDGFDWNSIKTEGDPMWLTAFYETPALHVMVNDIDYGWTDHTMYDSYINENGALCVQYHVAAKQAIPETFTLKMTLNAKGKGFWKDVKQSDFVVSVDRSATIGADRVVGPQTVDFGNGYALDLLEIRQSGMSLAVRYKQNAEENKGFDFVLADENGTIYNPVRQTLNPNSDDGITVREYQLPQQTVKEFTLIPVKYNETESTTVGNTYSVTDIGAQMPTTNLGGFILKDYKVEDSRVTAVLQPYGVCLPMNVELIMQDDSVSMRQNDEGVHSAIQNRKTDYTTGEVTFTLDYYKATEEELKQITKFELPQTNGYELQENQSVKLAAEG